MEDDKLGLALGRVDAGKAENRWSHGCNVGRLGLKCSGIRSLKRPKILESMKDEEAEIFTKANSDSLRRSYTLRGKQGFIFVVVRVIRQTTRT